MVRREGKTDGELVLLGQLVHAENGDDVLETLVVLEDLLDCKSRMFPRSARAAAKEARDGAQTVGGDVVVLLADDTGVEHAALGVEGVDGGVDTELGDTTRQDGGSIEMGEGGGRRGVGQVIGGDVDGLDGGDGSLLGRARAPRRVSD